MPKLTNPLISVLCLCVEQTPLCTPQKRSTGIRSRRVLGDKNTKQPLDPTTAESFVSQINSSLASTVSYTDFKVSFN